MNVSSPSSTKLRARSLGRVAIGGSLLAASGGGLSLALESPASATATIYTVLNTNNSGVGSLRKAIDDANLNPGDDIIQFASGVTGTINLLTRLEVMHGLDIQGPGSSALTISGQNTTQIFYLYDHTGGATGNIAISGVTLTNAADASAIVCWQTNLTLDDVSILDSTVRDAGLNFIGGDGNGDAALTISDSTISGITSTVSARPGAGVWVSGGSNVSISSTTFSDNTAPGNGGGMKFANAGDVTISNSTFSGNSSVSGDGGAMEVANQGNFSLTNSTLESNSATMRGGAIFFSGSGSAGKTITIANSTIDGNTAASGSGLYLRTLSSVAINNSTIAGNSATSGGGGGVTFISTASAAINQSTITNNTSAGTNASFTGGGGILASGNGALTLSGTILSGNSSGVPAQNDLGLYMTSTLTNFTANSSLLGTIDARATVAGTGNVNSTAPTLGLLADNGGPTKTMLPLTDSPALDAGPNPVASFTGNGFDQRGTPYARISNGRADIGAVEVQVEEPPVDPTTSISPTTSTPIDPGSSDGTGPLPATGTDSRELALVGAGIFLVGAAGAGFAATRRIPRKH